MAANTRITVDQCNEIIDALRTALAEGSAGKSSVTIDTPNGATTVTWASLTELTSKIRQWEANRRMIRTPRRHFTIR